MNRMYGLIIGGAIGDAMGTTVSYAPDTLINTPFDTSKVGIKVGYWTEPTALTLSVLGYIGLPPTNIYDQYKISKHQTLATAAQASGAAILYYNDFTQLLTSSYSMGGNIAKLWASIIDTALHGGHKRTILNISSYSNIILSSDLLDIFPAIEQFDMDENSDLVYLREVLVTFAKTDNYIDGLKLITNNSLCPEWTATLYGHLAGAYYGLTDIPSEWMDCIQYSDMILSTLEGTVKLVPAGP